MTSTNDAATGSEHGSTATDFAELARARAILVTTCRRNGDAVATPVWLVVRDGRIDATTPARSGKAKRLRNEPRVLVAPSTQLGRRTGPTREGRARIITADEVPVVRSGIRRRSRSHFTESPQFRRIDSASLSYHDEDGSAR